MTDPRYPGWDHPTPETGYLPGMLHGTGGNRLDPAKARRPRPDGVPGPALVLALVVGVVVVIVGGLWVATR